MNVSGWSLARRLALPDWCFGNQELYGCHVNIWTSDTHKWVASIGNLPDPACIWSLGMIVYLNDDHDNRVRVGMRATVPTSSAEMDTATPIFPEFGVVAYTPPRMYALTIPGQYYIVHSRKGLVTSGHKIVVEGYVQAYASFLHVLVYVVASALPLRIPAHLDPGTV